VGTGSTLIAGTTYLLETTFVAGMVVTGTVRMCIWFGVTVVVLNRMALLGLVPMVLSRLTVVVWTTGLLCLVVNALLTWFGLTVTLLLLDCAETLPDLNGADSD
jgi:hypothetical protein